MAISCVVTMAYESPSSHSFGRSPTKHGRLSFGTRLAVVNIRSYILSSEEGGGGGHNSLSGAACPHMSTFRLMWFASLQFMNGSS